MPHSLVKIFMHIVFSTKHRHPYMIDEIQDEVFAYVGGICNSINCAPIKTGGFKDHAHVLCLLSKSVSAVDLIKEIKVGSSKWIKTKGIRYRDFHWQDGYGAFSVSPSHIEALCEYIDNQHEHHRMHSFQEEFLDLLKKYNLPYDEKYLWD